MNEITIKTDGGHDYMTATISQGNLERIEICALKEEVITPTAKQNNNGTIH